MKKRLGLVLHGQSPTANQRLSQASKRAHLSSKELGLLCPKACVGGKGGGFHPSIHPSIHQKS
jgi:hypothetical protein